VANAEAQIFYSTTAGMPISRGGNPSMGSATLPCPLKKWIGVCVGVEGELQSGSRWASTA
jgi:hypothetical protein